MHLTDLPLYPKISSIYNKILKLIIAVVITAVIFTLWVDNFSDNEHSFDQHFQAIGNSFIQQSVVTAKVLIENNDIEKIERYIETLPQTEIVFDAHFYDVTGQTIASSSKSQTINELYGQSASLKNVSREFVPFISEVRGDKLHGYIRITLIKEQVTKSLFVRVKNQAGQILTMLLLSVVVGILLTKGLRSRRVLGHKVLAKK